MTYKPYIKSYKKPYINNHINKAGGIICSPHFDKILCSHSLQRRVRSR